jgi:2,4-dichlorophenol 6-monooxygenase
LWMTSLGGDGPYDRIIYAESDGLGGGRYQPLYDAKGCARPTNIFQMYLEPILAQVAEERKPGRVLFRHELVSFEQDEDGVRALVRDLEADEDVEVRCRYLLGADGGRAVGPALGIERVGGPAPLDFVSIWVSADLSEYIHEDTAVMRYLIHPSRPDRFCGLLMVGPDRWDRHSSEWTVNVSRDPSLPPLSVEEAEAECRLLLGVGDDVEITVHLISAWQIEVILSDSFAQGRVFLIGDAAHKHTPGAGLGANSAFQDAHNIAWKLALVLRGLAPPSLLDSYEAERRPVVMRNAEWSAFTMPAFRTYVTATGMELGGSVEQNEAAFAQLISDTPVGAAMRAFAAEAIKLQRIEVAAHDMEMGFTYDQGAVVDDGSPPAWRDPLGHDYRPTSRPGSRMPHAWLELGGERVSTHDLVPIDGFLLLTDPSGQDWADAAEKVAAERGVEIRVVRVGEGGECRDPEQAWQQAREIEDGGALLIRPDGHVGFRAKNAVADPRNELDNALTAVLSGGDTTSQAQAPQSPGLHQLASAFGGNDR